jgi:hypothetical protein
MPANPYGQMITFSLYQDQDWPDLGHWRWMHVRVGDTVRSMAARGGHPYLARQIADRNKIRSTTQVLHHRPKRRTDLMRIRVPGKLRDEAGFSVLAGDQPPRVTGGYAKFSTVDRPLRTGLTQFDGYDPITMEVPIRFENFNGDLDNVRGASGAQIEDDIALLERMAGRGNFRGAAVGPPPIIVITATNDSGVPVGLIPRNYQWTRANPNAPKWRVTSIDWDAEPLRNSWGNRIRQKATVSVQQHTRIALATKKAT